MTAYRSHSLRFPLELSTKEEGTFPEPRGFTWGQTGSVERHSAGLQYLIPALSRAQAVTSLPAPVAGAGDVPTHTLTPAATWAPVRAHKKI